MNDNRHIEIIPAIDIINGRCVRLTQGDYAREKVYDVDPVAMAGKYAEAGVRRIHIVDLDGARSSEPCNLDVLRRMASSVECEIEWGGGIKSEDSLKMVLDCGAHCAIVGSMAARQPDLMKQWLDRYGADRVVLGADVREGLIAVNGWSETVSISVSALISEFLSHGLNNVICTDISRDGLLAGPATELYTALQQEFPDVDVTVSGGISSMRDIAELDRLGLRKVIVGKAIYENRISLDDIREWSQKIFESWLLKE